MSVRQHNVMCIMRQEAEMEVKKILNYSHLADNYEINLLRNVYRDAKHLLERVDNLYGSEQNTYAPSEMLRKSIGVYEENVSLGGNK